MAILTNLLNTTNKMIDSIVQIKDNFTLIATVIKDGGVVLVGGATDDGVNQLQVNGSAKISNLAGTGNRAVFVDSTGNLSASANPVVYQKVLTGTTASAQGGVTQLPHNIDDSKIVSISALVEFSSGSGMPANYTHSAGYEYNIYHSGGNANLVNSSTNSNNILSKPFKFVVSYTD